jgi:hypothetical protein
MPLSVREQRRHEAHAQSRAEFDRLGVKHVDCKTCGCPTNMTGTKLCDGCWEVERRLVGYLRDGGDKARQFVFAAIEQAKR